MEKRYHEVFGNSNEKERERSQKEEGGYGKRPQHLDTISTISILPLNILKRYKRLTVTKVKKCGTDLLWND